MDVKYEIEGEELTESVMAALRKNKLIHFEHRIIKLHSNEDGTFDIHVTIQFVWMDGFIAKRYKKGKYDELIEQEVKAMALKKNEPQPKSEGLIGKVCSKCGDTTENGREDEGKWICNHCVAKEASK